jgi:hypothetical protein
LHALEETLDDLKIKSVPKIIFCDDIFPVLLHSCSIGKLDKTTLMGLDSNLFCLIYTLVVFVIEEEVQLNARTGHVQNDNYRCYEKE